MLKKLFAGAVAAAMVTGASYETAQAEDTLYVPSLSYRTGPFAGAGVQIANGFADYFAMLNARDGGIGGAKVVMEECETAYNAQKGVECYEATKGKGALVYNPYSTGITLQLIPKAPVDEIPILSMGYGLSAAAKGETFPWTFTYPASYWSQMSSILKYIDANGGVEGKKIGFIYLDVGYGKEPIPMLEELAPKMGFEVAYFPVGVKEMQAQSAQWLNVRKERPDWMVMWGFGAMNASAIKEAAKIRYPMDKFIGNWWAAADVDLRPGLARRGDLAGLGVECPQPVCDLCCGKYLGEVLIQSGLLLLGQDQLRRAENVDDQLKLGGLFLEHVHPAVVHCPREDVRRLVTGELGIQVVLFERLLHGQPIHHELRPANRIVFGERPFEHEIRTLPCHERTKERVLIDDSITNLHHGV